MHIYTLRSRTDVRVAYAKKENGLVKCIVTQGIHFTETSKSNLPTPQEGEEIVLS